MPRSATSLEHARLRDATVQDPHRRRRSRPGAGRGSAPDRQPTKAERRRWPSSPARPDATSASPTVGPSWGKRDQQEGRTRPDRLPRSSITAVHHDPARVADGRRRRLAVIHDVLISVGVYPSSRSRSRRRRWSPSSPSSATRSTTPSSSTTRCSENQATVGARRAITYTDMVNLSMNQVLLRSLNTSIVGAPAGDVDARHRRLHPGRGHPRGVRPRPARRPGRRCLLVDLHRRPDRGAAQGARAPQQGHPRAPRGQASRPGWPAPAEAATGRRRARRGRPVPRRRQRRERRHRHAATRGHAVLGQPPAPPAQEGQDAR